jgi:protein-ribulosamine 3-kinase
LTLDNKIEAGIFEKTGQEARIKQVRRVTGGSINNSRKIDLVDGRIFFVKTHPYSQHFPGMYETEFHALELLSIPGIIHVPKPVVYSDDFIVMEYINQGSPVTDWHEIMGRQLAEIHKATCQHDFGFYRDNYLGITVQPNAWTDNWLEFWRDRRLAWQLELYRNKTKSDDPLLSFGEKLINRLDRYLGHLDEPAVLLHGDLWAGNASCNAEGLPVIFDPASYYGHREAELGMMRLFGGFGPRSESAYQEIWSLESGSDERISIYSLYHELNHLNLFGKSYYESCITRIKQLL